MSELLPLRQGSVKVLVTADSRWIFFRNPLGAGVLLLDLCRQTVTPFVRPGDAADHILRARDEDDADEVDFSSFLSPRTQDGGPY